MNSGYFEIKRTINWLGEPQDTVDLRYNDGGAIDGVTETLTVEEANDLIACLQVDMLELNKEIVEELKLRIEEKDIKIRNLETLLKLSDDELANLRRNQIEPPKPDKKTKKTLRLRAGEMKQQDFLIH